MKRFLPCLFLICGFVCVSHAQSIPSKQKAPRPVRVLPISDVTSTVNGIVSVLKTKLALSDSQSPSVVNVITDFIGKKIPILPLATTDPGTYKNKFAGIQQLMMTEFNSLLTGAQYSKLLSLKPRQAKTDDILSHLFF